MFFFEEIGKEETEGGRMGHKKKTYHNSQRAVACNMFNLKNLIKIVSRPSQLSVKQSTLKPNN